MTTIFHNDEKSPNCLKTKILLNELETAYEQVEHDFVAGDLKKPSFQDKFPNARVPALEDGESCISESGAIASYLADKHGRLIPKDPAHRALMYQALNLESGLLAPTIGGGGIFGEMAKPEEERDQRRLAHLGAEAQRVSAVLEAVLGDRDYFAGEYSIADIQLFPGASKALKFGVLKSEALERWAARVAARPAVRKAMQDYPMYRE